MVDDRVEDEVSNVQLAIGRVGWLSLYFLLMGSIPAA
jgi:hypothetical protein